MRFDNTVRAFVTELRLVPAPLKRPSKRHGVNVEAGDVEEHQRRAIVADFYALHSSRKVARKHKLPERVVRDILFLHMRQGPQSERLAVAARRSA